MILEFFMLIQDSFVISGFDIFCMQKTVEFGCVKFCS